MKNFKIILPILFLFILLCASAQAEVFSIKEDFNDLTFFKAFKELQQLNNTAKVSCIDSFDRGAYYLDFCKVSTFGTSINNVSISQNWTSSYGKQFIYYDDSTSQFYFPVLNFRFKDPVSFSERSEIFITGNSSIVNPSSNYRADFLLKRANGNCTILFRDSVISSGNLMDMINGVVPLFPSGLCSGGMGSYNITDMNVIEFTGGATYTKNYTISVKNVSNLQYITNVFLILSKEIMIPNSKYFIDNIEFRNIQNGTNALPEVNASLNKNYVCINDTSDYSIPLNISSFDIEGDKILYTMQDLTYLQNWKTIEFTKSVCIPEACIRTKDFSFLDNIVYPSWTSCRINTGKEINLSMLNVLSALEEGATENKYNYVLALSGYCQGFDNAFYYDFKNNIDDLKFNVVVEGLNQDSKNEEFNISFYDENLVEKINLRVIQNSATWGTIWLKNISQANATAYLLINYAPPSFPMNVSVLQYGEFMEVSLKNTTAKVNLTQFGIVPTIFKYFSMSVNETYDVKIRQFSYGSLDTSPSGFTEIKPNSLNFEGIGEHRKVLYSSDEVNILNGNYNKEEFSFSVYRQDSSNPLCYLDNPNLNLQFYFDNPNEYPPQDSIGNQILLLFRMLTIIASQLGFLETLRILIKFMLIYGIYRLYSKFSEAQIPANDIFKRIFIIYFFFITYLYLALLVEKTYFVIFSTIGMLYFSYEINIMTSGSAEGNTEKQIIYATGFYSLFSLLFYGFLQITFNAPMGIPSFEMPDLTSLSGIIGFFPSLLSYLINLLLFTIPEMPIIFNGFIVLLRLISLVSLVSVIRNFINPLNQG